jgi:hypothetical protein
VLRTKLLLVTVRGKLYSRASYMVYTQADWLIATWSSSYFHTDCIHYVQGLGFRVYLGFRVQGLLFMIYYL